MLSSCVSPADDVAAGLAEQDDGYGGATTVTGPSEITQSGGTTDASEPVLEGESTGGTTGEGAKDTNDAKPSATPPVLHIYQESTDALKNPHKGWLPYVFDPLQPAQFDDSPLASEIYTNYVTWNDFEPLEGEYQWDVLEGLAAVASERGKKLRLAINSVDPTSLNRQQVPTWYIEQAASQQPSAGRWIDTWYGNPISINPYSGNPSQATGGFYIYEPDYGSALYTQKYFEFLRELSDRIYAHGDYADSEPLDGLISNIEISNYGYWGEWHTEYSWPNSVVKQEVLEGFSDWIFALYPSTAEPTSPAMSTEISTLFSDLSSGAYDTGVGHAVLGGADMVRKCIGICTHGFLSDTDRGLIESWIPYRSFRGEWGSWSGEIESFYPSPTSGQTVNDLSGAIDEALALNVSMLGWYVNSSLEQLRPNTDETHAEYFQKRCGYRFWLQQASFSESVVPGSSFELELEWFQRATGKLYRAYDLRLQLRDEVRGTTVALGTSGFAGHSWPPGPGGPYSETEQFTVPPDVEPGVYALELAVVDDRGQPAMNLANASLKVGGDPYAYSDYALGSVVVLD